MISSRYVPAVCVLLALALVPTAIHSYAAVVVSDNLRTESIPVALGEFASTPSGRDAGWGGRRFESPDWFERKYVSASDELLLTVLRSYNLKLLYHHPELDVAYGTAFLRQETRRFEAHPEIPIHVLYSDVDGGSIAAYALHYDGQFVDDPMWFQLRSATELLFSGRPGRPTSPIFH
jgi:hypothetical protein